MERINTPYVKSGTCSTYHCNFKQLESQLQQTQQELSSVEIMVNILNEELDVMRKTSRINPNEIQTWSSVKPNKAAVSTIPLNHHGPLYTDHQYTIPVSNRYAPLSTNKEPQTNLNLTIPEPRRLVNHEPKR